jgi:hypothetical protein
MTMVKFINVEEARAYALEHFPSPVVRKPIETVLDNCPLVEVVQVVHCKDCKHYCPYDGEEHKGDCLELVGLESCVYQEDFCSYGERRDNK